MAAVAEIQFRADSQQAQRAINALEKEVAALSTRLNTTQQTSRQTTTGIDAVGTTSRQTSTQVRTASSALDALEQSMNEARRAGLTMRSSINDLNAELSENRKRLLTADAAQKELLETRNRVIRVNQGLIRSEQQRNSLLLANLTQQRRELGGLNRGFRDAGGGASFLSRAGTELAGVLGGIGIAEVAFRLVDFTRNAAQASIQLDSTTRALAVMTGSTAEAERAVRELQEIADEPGLRFQQAVDGTLALRAIGVEAEQTTRILRELANAAAFSGGSGEFERGLLGFRQLIQRGRLSQEEINQLTENISLASRVLRDEFGTVLAEDIQAQLDATGQTIDDFVERTISGFERLERFPLDAPSVKLKNLSNSFFEFSAAVGDQFLPIIARGAEGLTKFFDTLTELISGTDAATESVNNFRDAIVEADTAIARDDAIQNRIRFLREYIAELEEANRQRGIFDGRGRAIAQGQITSETAELGRLQQIQTGDPAIIAQLTAEVERLNQSLADHQQIQTDLENTASRYSENQQRRFNIRRQRLDEEEAEILKQIELRESELQTATEAAGGVADAEREKIQASKDATEAAEAAATAAQAQTDALIAQIKATQQTRENLEALAEAQAVMNDFWRVASGDVQAYTGSVDVATISVIDHRKELELLQQVFENTQDPFKRYTDQYGTVDNAVKNITESTREYAISQEVANAQARLVNPAVTEAARSIRNYVEVLDGTQQSYVELQDVSQRVTERIRMNASAFDRLREAQAAARRETDTLRSSLANLPSVQSPGTQGRFTNQGGAFGDVLSGAAFDLAGQALTSAQNQRQIEEDRIQSLAEAEQEYSDRVAAINEQKRQRLHQIARQIYDAEVQRLEDIQAAYQTAADAEVEAREQAAERIAALDDRYEEQRGQLVERLTDRLISLEERRDERIQALNDGYIEREARRAERILEIATRATEQREDIEERYTERVQDITNQLVLDVRAIWEDATQEQDRLREGFADREEGRAERITQAEEQAAEDREQAHRTFATTMEGVYRDLVDEWDALAEGFTEREEERAEERVEIEKEAAEERVRIEEEATQERIEAGQEYNQTLIDIANDVVAEFAEIEAERTQIVAEAAAERVEIAEEATQARIDAEEDYTDTLAGIANDVVAEFADIEAERTQIVAEAAADRIEIIEDAAEERAEIESEAIDNRLEAEETYTETIAEIATGLVDTFADIEAERTRIVADATQARIDAEQDLADEVQGIYNDLYLEVVGIEERREQALADIRQDALDAEQDRLDDLADLQEDHNTRILDLEEDLHDDLDDLRRDRFRTAEDIQREYQRDLEDLYTETARRLFGDDVISAADLTDAQRQQVESSSRFQQGRFDLESERRRDVQDLQTETGILTPGSAGYNFYRQQLESGQLTDQRLIESLFGREGLDDFVDNTRSVEDAVDRLNEDTTEINKNALEQLTEINAKTPEVNAQADADITQAEVAAGVTLAQAAENYVPALSAHQQAIADHTAAINRINAGETTALGLLDDRETEALRMAGLTFTEALALATPEIDDATAAFNKLTETLDEIDDGVTEALGVVDDAETRRLGEVDDQEETDLAGLTARETAALKEAGLTFTQALALASPEVDKATAALNTLTETLGEIDRIEKERLKNVNTEETRQLGILTAQETAALKEAGLTFTQALALASPEVDKATAAFNTLTETLGKINTEEERKLGLVDEGETAALGAVDDASTQDRTETTDAQTELETAAGVTIEEARANYVPALTAAAQATLTLNTTLGDIDTSLMELKDTLDDESTADRIATNAAIQAVADAAVQNVIGLEAAAGITFSDATANFAAAPSAIEQAGIDRDTGLAGVNAEETDAINEVNDQGVADLLRTDAQKTTARDQYIVARDATIAQHNAAVLALNIGHADDVSDVKDRLDETLVDIDQTLIDTLAEIRDDKVAFDTKMNELIQAINNQANVATINAGRDLTLARERLDELAEEAKNNQWKADIGKIANVGLTIAGGVVGTVVAGNPLAGAAVGQAVGGLAEQAIVGDLFHFTATDRIARRTAFEAASTQRRDPYFPTPQQLQNARDVSREIVSGFTEGLQAEATRNGGLSAELNGGGTPENEPVVLQFQFEDGTISELTGQIRRLQQQDRSSF